MTLDTYIRYFKIIFKLVAFLSRRTWHWCRGELFLLPEVRKRDCGCFFLPGGPISYCAILRHRANTAQHHRWQRDGDQSLPWHLQVPGVNPARVSELLRSVSAVIRLVARIINFLLEGLMGEEKTGLYDTFYPVNTSILINPVPYRTFCPSHFQQGFY